MISEPLARYALLWALADDDRLGHARAPVSAPRSRVYVSAASAWEIAIKVSLGKLKIPPNLPTWLPAASAAARFTPLAITLDHVLAVEALPRHHTDPFDRLLVAQAIVERLTIVTGDPQREHYAIPVIRG